MTEIDSFSSILYAVTLRIIQPARIQDVFSKISEFWGDEAASISREAIYASHDWFRSEGLVLSVRKGTYILSARGLLISEGMAKPRKLDNLRLFLMKRQRKAYRQVARRYE